MKGGRASAWYVCAHGAATPPQSSPVIQVDSTQPRCFTSASSFACGSDTCFCTWRRHVTAPRGCTDVASPSSRVRSTDGPTGTINRYCTMHSSAVLHSHYVTHSSLSGNPVASLFYESFKFQYALAAHSGTQDGYAKVRSSIRHRPPTTNLAQSFVLTVAGIVSCGASPESTSFLFPSSSGGLTPF